MSNKHLFFATLLSGLATLNSHAMDPLRTEARLWTPKIKPALYLNVRNETDCTNLIDALSQHGTRSETLDSHFPYTLKDCKTLELSAFLAQNYASQQLIKTALIFAKANGKSKIGFERSRSDCAGLHKAQFVASIVFVHPNIFQVKVTEDTPKNTQGQP